ncbi:MAG: HTH domain-containing protein, partial [Planctomycetes bacterium]|nr:HTH domain-containing protein [Planctomycetota bacterium]
MAMERKQFRCGQCGKKVNTVDAERVTARRCTTCSPDLAMLPAMRSNPAKESRKAVAAAVAPKASVPARKRQGVARPVTVSTGEAVVSVAEPEVAEVPKAAPPVVGPEVAIEPVVAKKLVASAKERKTVNPVDPASEVVKPPVAEAKPAAVPSAEVALLDQRIAEVREAMNRLASELSVKRIELVGLRDQRAALGPAPRSRRDPDAPRRFTLLDAAAQVLDNAMETMGAKAIWRAIVERGLWSSPNGGKTP